MFYYYIRFFNWICSIFGLRKPFRSFQVRNKYRSLMFWNKIWSLCIALSIVATHLIFVDLKLEFNIKNNFNEISNMNNILTNAIILIIPIANGDNLYIKIYETINRTLFKLKLDNRSIWMMSLKLYFWFSIQSVVFLTFIIVEFIFGDPPYVMIIRIPLFLTIYHLLIHLCLIASILKVINSELIEKLKVKNDPTCRIFFLKPQRTKRNFNYLVDHNIYFECKKTKRAPSNFPFMCKTYDDLCTCIHLLQKCHGVEVC